MDVDIKLDGSTVTSSKLLVLDANKNCTAEAEDMEGLATLHLTNLTMGTYHVLCKSYDDSGPLAINITGHSEVGIEDTDTSTTNHIIERTYTNAEGSSWNDKICYYDEMGREQETLLKSYSPDDQYIYSDIVYRIYKNCKHFLSANDTLYILTDSKYISYKVNIRQIGKLNQMPADNRIKGNNIQCVYKLNELEFHRNCIIINVSCYGASYREGSLRLYYGGCKIFKYRYNKQKKKYIFSSCKVYGI